jgi:hypothetical protein
MFTWGEPPDKTRQAVHLPKTTASEARPQMRKQRIMFHGVLWAFLRFLLDLMVDSMKSASPWRVQVCLSGVVGQLPPAVHLFVNSSFTALCSEGEG